MSKRPAITIEERFWSKVDKDGPTMPHMDTNCWVWTGATNGRYPRFSADGRMCYAHRFVVERIEHLALTSDDEVCHSCDNPLCVRAGHLFVGSHTTNMRDCSSKGRLGGFTGDPRKRPRGNRHWTRVRNEDLPRGEDHPNSLVTEDDVRLIRLLGKKGYSYPQIAEISKVPKGNVAAIIQGRTWGHVR